MAATVTTANLGFFILKRFIIGNRQHCNVFKLQRKGFPSSFGSATLYYLFYLRFLLYSLLLRRIQQHRFFLSLVLFKRTHRKLPGDRLFLKIFPTFRNPFECHFYWDILLLENHFYWCRSFHICGRQGCSSRSCECTKSNQGINGGNRRSLGLQKQIFGRVEWQRAIIEEERSVRFGRDFRR